MNGKRFDDNKNNDRVRFNHFIRVPQVRVIGSDGEQIGVLETRAAIQRAQDEGLDLIEISPNASPPVCRIMDQGKYKYQISKKKKDAKKRQHVVKLKEIKLRPKTDDHDYKYKMEHARAFLNKGDRVKITIVFKGREMAHLEFGRELVDRIKDDLKDVASLESAGKMMGKRMMSILVPTVSKSKVSKSKEQQPNTENEQKG